MVQCCCSLIAVPGRPEEKLTKELRTVHPAVLQCFYCSIVAVVLQCCDIMCSVAVVMHVVTLFAVLLQWCCSGVT